MTPQQRADELLKVWRYARDSGASPDRAMFAVDMVDVLMSTTILKREIKNAFQTANP